MHSGQKQVTSGFHDENHINIKLINIGSLVGAILASFLWYVRPEVGAWPLLLLLLPWGGRLVLQRCLFQRTPYDWALLLFLVTAGLSVWAAYDRPVALAKFWLIVGGIVLFYTFSNWMSDDERATGWLAALLVLFGAGVAIYFLAVHDWNQYPAQYRLLTNLGVRLQAPLEGLLAGGDWHRLHPNVVGGILAFTVPLAGVIAWWVARQKRWFYFVPAMLLLVVILFGLLMSSSRGAWLALGSALGLTIGWQLPRWLAGRYWWKSHRIRYRMVFAGGLAAIMILVLLVLLLLPGWRQGALAVFSELIPTNRPDLYRDSLDLIQDYPLIGGGLDLFMMLHASYVLLSHVGFSVHSHSLYLDLAIEQGLPGLFALFWLWSIFALILWQIAGRGDDERENALAEFNRLAVGAAALALVTIAVHGLVDDAFYGSRAVMLLFLPLSFSAGKLLLNQVEATTEPGRRGRSRQLANVVVGGALSAMLVLVVLVPAGRSLMWSNLAAIRQSQAEMSVYSWPEWPIQDELRRQLDMGAIISELERALALHPKNVSANRRLGMIKLSLGEYEDALRHLQAAYDGAPWDNAARQLLGEALIANGRVNEGVKMWQTVETGQNQLQLRLFWYQHIGDTQRAAWVEEGLRLVENDPR